MPPLNLREQAGRFAKELSGLLNSTVCHGVRVTSIISSPRRAVVGYKISKDDQDTTEGIPVTRSAKHPTCYIGLSYRLGADDAGKYLMVTSSFIGLFADPDLDQVLFHYDYERDKGDGYPEAHLQVCADSPAWSVISERTGQTNRPLQKLHLPVGGRRFRPTLEDLIDFIVTEGLADAQHGWHSRVEAGREQFQRRQLRAAVRRDPDSAIALLREEGHL